MGQIKLVWELISLAIKFGPKIVELIRAILEALKGSKDPQVADMGRKLEESAKEYRDGKNKQQLDDRMTEIIRNIGHGGGW